MENRLKFKIVSDSQFNGKWKTFFFLGRIFQLYFWAQFSSTFDLSDTFSGLLGTEMLRNSENCFLQDRSEDSALISNNISVESYSNAAAVEYSEVLIFHNYWPWGQAEKHDAQSCVLYISNELQERIRIAGHGEKTPG